ncbi:MAG: tripartite tricarboxylate transporter substrate binding protein [Burkholderiales bacterium]
MKGSACLLVLAAALGAASAIGAENYPVRPIRMIIPSGAGGITDILGRVLAQKLTESLGQQVIVDNRPGASGIIGSQIVAKSAPDGYTLLMVYPSHTVNQSLYRDIPYDTAKAFAPITMVSAVAPVLIVSSQSPARTMRELIDLAKAKPGALNHASLGSGSTSHLTMEMFKAAAGIRMNHVPYKGSPAAHADLMGGQVPVMFDAIPAVLPHIKSGKLRGLGIGTLARSPFLPDLPTIADSGYPGFEAVGWIGIVAPAKTPEAILNKLNAEIVRMLKDPDVKQRLDTLAFTPVGGTRAEFAAFIKSEIAKWGKAVKASGAKAD